MESRRAPQGLDAEDRIALGLTAPRLLYLIVFSMSGWGLLSSPFPALVRIPPAVLLFGAGAALAWGRVGGRPADRWMILAAAYFLRPRRSNTAATAAPGAAGKGSVDIPAGTADPRPGLDNVIPLPVRSMPALHRARRVAFFSLRGGTGKSTLAAELAAGIAAGVLGPDDGERVTRVALLDFDLRASTLCVALGLEQPDVGNDPPRLPVVAEIERRLLRHESGMRVLPAPCAGEVDSKFETITAPVLDHLDTLGYDLVFLDIATGLDELGARILDAADEIYCVFSATAPGIYDLYRSVKTLRALGHRQKIRYIANRHDPADDLSEVLRDLRGVLAGSVPERQALRDAANTHRCAVLEDVMTAQSLEPLARSVMGGLGYSEGVAVRM